MVNPYLIAGVTAVNLTPIFNPNNNDSDRSPNPPRNLITETVRARLSMSTPHNISKPGTTGPYHLYLRFCQTTAVRFQDWVSRWL
ncbi:hypothetical protein [Planktothrix tepida]|uniref:hypothetical protein n=1 Tax=Planktothrix tepida TaxID=1678309 RepID=UPI00111524C6|nr:hypothetical protein [Planktothrix tepida]